MCGDGFTQSNTKPRTTTTRRSHSKALADLTTANGCKPSRTGSRHPGVNAKRKTRKHREKGATYTVKRKRRGSKRIKRRVPHTHRLLLGGRYEGSAHEGITGVQISRGEGSSQPSAARKVWDADTHGFTSRHTRKDTSTSRAQSPITWITNPTYTYHNARARIRRLPYSPREQAQMVHEKRTDKRTSTDAVADGSKGVKEVLRVCDGHGGARAEWLAPSLSSVSLGPHLPLTLKVRAHVGVHAAKLLRRAGRRVPQLKAKEERTGKAELCKHMRAVVHIRTLTVRATGAKTQKV